MQIGNMLAGLGAGLFEGHQDRKFAREMDNKMYQRQLQAEDRERAYNDPAAQMKRLENAGLNPALIYGAGSAGASGTVQSSAGGAPSSVKHSTKIDPLSAAQLDIMESQGRVQDATARQQNALADIAEWDRDITRSRPGLKSTESAIDGVVKNIIPEDPIARVSSWKDDIADWMQERIEKNFFPSEDERRARIEAKHRAKWTPAMQVARTIKK